MVDKSTWGPGPWQEEPDKVQWIDEATDLDCLIVRGPLGSLCGYVGVPPGHPWHGLSYSDWDGPVDVDSHVSVHGGLTYSGACDEGPEERSICHVPAPGRPADVWWFGFDTAHLNDRMPGHEARMREVDLQPTFERGGTWSRTYKTVDYVRRECEELARQLREAVDVG